MEELTLAGDRMPVRRVQFAIIVLVTGAPNLGCVPDHLFGDQFCLDSCPQPPPYLQVTPATAVVDPGETQQFAATHEGTSVAVTWSAQMGTISSAGLYTAPTGAFGNDVVTATSAGGTQTAVVFLPNPLCSSAEVAVVLAPWTFRYMTCTAAHQWTVTVAIDPAAFGNDTPGFQIPDLYPAFLGGDHASTAAQRWTCGSDGAALIPPVDGTCAPQADAWGGHLEITQHGPYLFTFDEVSLAFSVSLAPGRDGVASP